jgi:hypothetical protein
MNDDLTNLDTEALRDRYAEMVSRHEKTMHVGRKNRIFDWEREIGERLITVGGDTAREVMPLLDHRSEAVRLAAAYLIKPYDRARFVGILGGLVSSHSETGREARFGLAHLTEEKSSPPSPEDTPFTPDPDWCRIFDWQQDNLPPLAMSLAHLADRAQTEFTAAHARQILDLVRPAIGFWPQRQAPADIISTSRHGGPLWAPERWTWPIYEEEPMCFLGQIHCPDLPALPDADVLPRDGILAFLGDHDVISGCFPGGGSEEGMVSYWPAKQLVAARPPLPPLSEYCREYQDATHLMFRPFLDLPDPGSAMVEGLGLDSHQQEGYAALRDAARYWGIPEDVAPHCQYDKLLGWPDLVQGDFDLPQAGENAYRLLAQLPARMGPGGSLYFFIRDEDLAARRFDRCVLEAQNT